MKKAILLSCLLLTHYAYAQQKINAMFYNLYRFPDNPPANRELILKNILDEYQPDLFMVCELVREQGADRILNAALQTPQFNFARAAFTPTTIAVSDPLQQMVFYNRDKLTLIGQETLPTQVREINKYSFVLNTSEVTADSVFLHVFVTHLKSSDGADNRQARLKMIDTFVKALENIPADHYVLLAGDFNFYSAWSEPAYQKIIDPSNPVVMVDPINMPGNWSDNDSFKTIHTQATRTSAAGFGLGGATGGLDDRFDFIMMSENLLNAAGLKYVQGSYKAFGNNSNCFNERIDSYDCDGPYSLALRQNLHNMSDHLPVVMQLETSRHFLGISETPVKLRVSFPEGNMAQNHLLVKTEPSGQGLEMTVYNTLGQPIRTIKTPANEAVTRIYTGDMAAGVYYLKVMGKKQAVVRFLKQ